MKKTLAVLTLAGLVFGAACSDMTTSPPSGPQFSHGGLHPLVEGQQRDGNLTCSALFSPGPAYEVKVDPPKDGTYGPDGVIRVTFSEGGKQVSFDSDVSVLAVFVKGGNEGGNFYDYRTLTPPGTTSDSNLRTPTNQEISHVSFCWDAPPTVTPGALNAQKTAVGSYDRTITWELKKSVDPDNHSGLIGEVAGTSTWTVEAIKRVVEDNYVVSGEITVWNPTGAEVSIAITDELDSELVNVICPSGDNTATLQPGTPANPTSVVCTYEVETEDASAEFNEAVIAVTESSAGFEISGTTANANVSWEPNVDGHESGTLSDPRFAGPPWNYEAETISETTTRTFEETFPCTSDRSLYTNGVYTRPETNWAYLNGNLDLAARADVTITCRDPWVGETATGRGTQWPGTSNWFMYTGYTTSKVDLVAGRTFMDAGDIFMSRSGTTTTIRIVLHEGWRWAEVAENLKIVPLDSAPKSYIEPGAFPHKFTVSGNEISVNIPNSSKAKFFGIHGDVERFVP